MNLWLALQNSFFAIVISNYVLHLFTHIVISTIITSAFEPIGLVDKKKVGTQIRLDQDLMVWVYIHTLEPWTN